MASAGGDAEGGQPPETPGARTGVDRRAEALRANLRRRKAQTRARGEAGHGGPPAAPEPDAPDRDG